MDITEKGTGNKVIGILLRRLNKKKYFNKWKNSKDNQYLLYTINNNVIFINGIKENKEIIPLSTITPVEFSIESVKNEEEDNHIYSNSSSTMYSSTRIIPKFIFSTNIINVKYRYGYTI